MIAIIYVIVIPHHSITERSFRTLHRAEIFTFLSCFFLPQKEEEMDSQDKNAGSAPSWYNGLLLRSPCLHWAVLVCLLRQEQGEVQLRHPTGLLRVHI